MPLDRIEQVSREVARILESSFRRTGLTGEDLGTVIATTCGLLMGRTSLMPEATVAIATKAFRAGLLERQSQ